MPRPIAMDPSATVDGADTRRYDRSMYPAPVHHRVTEAEFLALPETMDRVELLDGEVIVAPSPLVRHQEVLGALFLQVAPWARANPPAKVFLAPLDIRFGPERILQPDLAVFVSAPPPADALPVPIVPEIVAEVLSQRRAYDRITKRAVYLEAGVREYWIVDPDNRVIEVVTPGASRLVDAELVSGVAVGLTVELEPLFTP